MSYAVLSLLCRVIVRSPRLGGPDNVALVALLSFGGNTAEYSIHLKY